MTTVATLAAQRRLDEDWLRDLGVTDLPAGGVAVAYLDADGGPLFERHRDVPGGPRFRQPRGVPPVPYGLWRLADLDGSTTLYLTEGESDAWALWAADLPALGLPGSDSAGCLEAAHLAGVECLLVCRDRDAGGERFVAAVAKRLAAVGFAGTAWAVTPAEPHKDVCAMRANDPEGFAVLWGECRTAAVRIAGPAAAATPEPEEDRAVITTLADVVPERITWLWQGYLPDGCLCVLDGDPGLGKSTLTLELASRLSRGEALPPLSGRDLGRGPCATLLLGAEDSLKHTVRPRLDAMGADVTLVHALEGFVTKDGRERLVVLPRDLERVADFISRHGVRLVVVDPLMAFLSSDTDAHKDQDVRRCLRPLAQLADRLGVVVLLLRHLNKLSGGPALYRGGSSIGITGAARASLIVGRDPDLDRSVLAMNKINVGPRPPSLAYRLEGHGLACRIVWEGEVDLRPDQIMGHGQAPRNESGQRKIGRPPSAIEVARQFLRHVLADGRVETREIMKRAADQLIAPATLDRARATLGVRAFREGKVYYMQLPARQAGTQSFDGAADCGDTPFDVTDEPDEPSDDEPAAD